MATQCHPVLLCLYVADPATFVAWNSVLEMLFSSENSLFIHLWKEFVLLPINTVNIKILGLNFFPSKPHSAPLI